VRVTPVKFNGASDYCGDIAKNARLHLSSIRANDVIAGVGLLDLYGLDSALTFPPGIVLPQQRREWAKRELETRVSHPNFRQYFAVHETEAWLLSDTKIFPSEIRNDLRAASNAPEQVDFNNPPARLLMHAYRDRLRRRYQKAVDGPGLFRLLEPDRACAKCPYLKAMLEEMLALANQALA
jgi:hypothetical protein